MSATRAVDGSTRDARGNLRFNKNTKRGREAEREDAPDLDELMGEKNQGQKKKKNRNEVGRLGEEFRAKRAGGDVKKVGGPDPYSYVPIGQAAARYKGGKGKVSLTNKKKGSRG